jgi:hypothetical protein
VHLLRRYLGAFGPAKLGGCLGLVGLTATTLRPAVAALDAAGELVRFCDRRGRELLDARGAPS